MTERSADSSTLRRIHDLLTQSRRKGGKWLVRRLRAEFAEPKRVPGKLGRAIKAGGHVALLSAANLLARPFTATSDAVTLFYDLDRSPATFDFCWALAGAERLRRDQGLACVNVVFVPGRHHGFRHEESGYDQVVTVDARRWRLDNILVPLCRLLPSLGGVTVCRDRREATRTRLLRTSHVYPPNYWPAYPQPHLPRQVMSMGSGPADVPRPFRASPKALSLVESWLNPRLGAKRLVTITLRRHGFMPERNSSLEGWADFARSLPPDQYLPVFIPDTDSAFESPDELTGLTTFPEASFNLGLRMALYETAFLNLMVNGGPYGLCQFSERARFLMFKIVTDGVPQADPAYLRYLGFSAGQTPAFAGPHQKWVWEDDTPEVIARAFAAMVTSIQHNVQSTPRACRQLSQNSTETS